MYTWIDVPPCLGQMLQYDTGLVLLDTLWHHVQDVVHHRRTQLQIEVRLNALFSHSLCHAL